MIPITKEHFEDATHPVSLHESRAFHKNNDMILLVKCGPEFYMFEAIGKHYEYYKLTKEEYYAKMCDLQISAI